ncbi:methyl-accepting chemotaxis protein [Devosia sp.]|uniref:methyl-accepting chemotaxis protein n=1 Tax=Devosia sp. TaxID=1871048 RepID=UPI0019E5A80D|nr:methyl-accepting chemotaxis protein [Devosia sp.]MBE0578895.1 cache domain-containing protein [Devosia sp.]
MQRRFNWGSVNVSLRLIISALVVTAVLGAVAALATGIYFSVSGNVVAQGRAQAQAALRTAATVFVGSADGYEVHWTAEGALDRITVWGLLPYRDHSLVETISRVTGAETSIYTVDRESGGLVVGTTTLTDSAARPAIGGMLDPAGPVMAALTQNRPYSAEETILGARYFTAYKQIVRDEEVVGVLLVALPLAQVEKSLSDVIDIVLKVSAAVTVLFGGLGYLASLLITRPIPRLVRTMRQIAGGNYQEPVPYTARTNEIGEIAKAVEIFRHNGITMVAMTTEEAANAERRRVERHDMMTALQREIGQVIGAAIRGDFSKQVTAEFPDPEINALATGINKLVDSVSLGLTETGAVLAAMAEADLTKRVHGNFEGAFARLRDDTNTVVSKLSEIVADVQTTSRGLRKATEEIMQGANDLSERTTRQAATIEETSAAVEQLSGIVASNARQAEEASGNADDAVATAEQGGEVMAMATAAMGRILTSSHEITGIIGVIDDIAFQTNLLALNASVEAARAGEAGKGFAVVAVEVRRLAQSAAEASRDVKLLVEQSAGEVRIGSKLVSEAADKLTAMLEATRANSRLMDSIARRSAEEAAAIEEVSGAVRTMDEMTQHNAALVEQTNAAITQTEAQARRLDGIIDIFAVDAESPERQFGSEAAGSGTRSHGTGAKPRPARDWRAAV